MIKCEIADGVCRAEVIGNAANTALEIAALVCSIYSSLVKSDLAEAALFRTCVEGILLGNSPVWERDQCEGVSMVIPMKRDDDGEE